jgi:hypothetical protein
MTMLWYDVSYVQLIFNTTRPLSREPKSQYSKLPGQSVHDHQC